MGGFAGFDRYSCCSVFNTARGSWFGYSPWAARRSAAAISDFGGEMHKVIANWPSGFHLEDRPYSMSHYLRVVAELTAHHSPLLLSQCSTVLRKIPLGDQKALPLF